MQPKPLPLEEPRPRVSELEYRLLTRPLHPELFVFRAGQRLLLPDCRLEAKLWLVDGGHVLEFTHPRGCLSETTGPRLPTPPSLGLVERLAFRGERLRDHRLPNGVAYSFALQVEQLSPMVFARVDEELRRTSEQAVAVCYEPGTAIIPSGSAPRRDDPARPGAFSCLEWHPLPRGLSVQSYHTFPDELTIIRTQSLLELPR